MGPCLGEIKLSNYVDIVSATFIDEETVDTLYVCVELLFNKNFDKIGIYSNNIKHAYHY